MTDTTLVVPTGGDVFNKPAVPLPARKHLYICDVSSETI